MEVPQVKTTGFALAEDFDVKVVFSIKMNRLDGRAECGTVNVFQGDENEATTRDDDDQQGF